MTRKYEVRTEEEGLGTGQDFTSTFLSRVKITFLYGSSKICQSSVVFWSKGESKNNLCRFLLILNKCPIHCSKKFSSLFGLHFQHFASRGHSMTSSIAQLCKYCLEDIQGLLALYSCYFLAGIITQVLNISVNATMKCSRNQLTANCYPKSDANMQPMENHTGNKFCSKLFPFVFF